MRKIDFVRKKGSTLKYWYDYVAVFSGSYIYFYPASDSAIIQSILRFYEQNDTLIMKEPKFGGRGRANTLTAKDASAQPGQKHLLDLDYEEYFLVKGCNQAQVYGAYLETVQQANKPDQNAALLENLVAQANHALRMVNSKNEEAILEFHDEKSVQVWKDLVEKRAEEIDQFLKKDKFRFGTFGSIDANQIMSKKVEELLLQE